MNKHEQALFDYMSEPGNFTTACEVAERLQWVKREIIASFWNELDSVMLQRMATDLPGWKTYMDENIFNKYAKYGIYNPDWDFSGEDEGPLFLCFESISGMYGKLFIGLSIDANNKQYDHKAIHMAFEGTSLQKRLSHHNDWWLFGKYLDDHFAQNSTLMKILPATRNTFVQELVSQIVALAKELEQVMDVKEMLNKSRL